DGALDVVRREDHDQVSLAGSLGWRHHPQTFGLSFRSTRRAFLQSDSNIYPGVAKAQRMCVALAAVSDDGDDPVLDDRQVRVVVVVHLCHEGISFFLDYFPRDHRRLSTSWRGQSPMITGSGCPSGRAVDGA